VTEDESQLLLFAVLAVKLGAYLSYRTLRGKNLHGSKDVFLKAKAKIWP